jgi:hypothetical protein
MFHKEHQQRCGEEVILPGYKPELFRSASYGLVIIRLFLLVLIITISKKYYDLPLKIN